MSDRMIPQLKHVQGENYRLTVSKPMPRTPMASKAELRKWHGCPPTVIPETDRNWRPKAFPL